MRISLAVVGAAAAWPSLSQIGSDATSFCEGVGSQLASNALGSDGMTAVQDTVDAAGDVGTAAEDFWSGNDSSAWDAIGAAGHKALGAASNALAQGVNDATNAALTGIAGAGLAAVQSIPGVNIAVDGGIAAYDGYKVGSDISGIVHDAETGNWKGAGEGVVNMGSDFNSAKGAITDLSDGKADNSFNWPTWGKKAVGDAEHALGAAGHYDDDGHGSARFPPWSPRHSRG